MPKTREGLEALQWCGKQPGVSRMVFFTGYKASALCPGGLMRINAPDGVVLVEAGQWVAKKDDGSLQVAGNDEIIQDSEAL